MRAQNVFIKLGIIGAIAISASLMITTVTAQELQTTSVPFKGTIAKDGDAELILRLYDRAIGGTKLFEETTVVEVSQGVYVAFMEVPSAVIARHPTVWMEVARQETPYLPLGARKPFAMRRAENNPQAITCPSGGCATLCFTCGGAYPFYNGGWPLAAGSMPTERGSSCSGTLTSVADTFPFLCTQ
jgi:hypothetical protein